MGRKPTFTEKLDFDEDCNRLYEFKIGNEGYTMDFWILWLIIICIAISICSCI